MKPDSLAHEYAIPGMHYPANSGVPAGWIGRSQKIEIGPMSGNSNVQHYLSSHGVPVTPELTKRIIDEAKKSPRVLTDSEILEIVRGFSP